MLVRLAAVLQVVEGLDLVQGVEQAPAEEADPQHAGRVHAELEAVQLSVQVGGRHWKRPTARVSPLSLLNNRIKTSDMAEKVLFFHSSENATLQMLLMR